jgi:hydroxymethylpyrimidine/phosphomethylpyrimidine kinase
LRRSKRLKLVVDPVMIATSGDPLLDAEAIETYERQLFPLATLITPNVDETARLLGYSTRNITAMRRAADQLAQKYAVPVLVKGGHLRQRRAVDILQFDRRSIEFGAAAVRGVRTHGTGCTYSAAIAAELAKGAQLIDAIRTAKRVVTAAIRQHFAWRRGAQKIQALNQSAPRR